MANFPDVIGAIDGTYIRIKVPENVQKDYLDITLNHNVNIIKVCDSKKCFRYISVGFIGPFHIQQLAG